MVELFSGKTTSHKDNLEVCLPNSRILSCHIGMWSSMKISLHRIRDLSKINLNVAYNFNILKIFLRAICSQTIARGYWPSSWSCASKQEGMTADSVKKPVHLKSEDL